jgi:hypothetical protein
MESKRQKSRIHNLESRNRREFKEMLNHSGTLILCTELQEKEKPQAIDHLRKEFVNSSFC